MASFYFYFCWHFTRFLRLTLNIRWCFSCCVSSETTGVHHHLPWSSLKDRYAVEMRSPETPALASFVFNKHLLLGNPACPACQLLPQALFTVACWLSWLDDWKEVWPETILTLIAVPGTQQGLVTVVRKWWRDTGRKMPAQSGRRQVSTAHFLRFSGFL